VGARAPIYPMSIFTDARMGEKYNYIYIKRNPFYAERRAAALARGEKDYIFDHKETQARLKQWDKNILRQQTRELEKSKKIQARRDEAKKRLAKTKYHEEWKRQQYIYNLEYEAKKNYKSVYVKARKDTIVPLY